MTGTLINAGSIVLGAGIGTVLGARLSEQLRGTVTAVLGLFVIVLGLADALDTFGEELRDALGPVAVLVVLGSLLLGGVVGELVDLEAQLRRLGTWLRDRTQRRSAATDGPDGDGQRFVEGFVVTSLLVCVGPLAILGPLQDGLTDGFELLAVKSVLDGVAALAFASVLGLGVAFAALPLLLLQGAITLAAVALSEVLDPVMVTALGATGGFLVMAIGVRLLELREIRVANLLPSLVIAPLLVAMLL